MPETDARLSLAPPFPSPSLHQYSPDFPDVFLRAAGIPDIYRLKRSPGSLYKHHYSEDRCHTPSTHNLAQYSPRTNVHARPGSPTRLCDSAIKAFATPTMSTYSSLRPAVNEFERNEANTNNEGALLSSDTSTPMLISKMLGLDNAVQVAWESTQPNARSGQAVMEGAFCRMLKHATDGFGVFTKPPFT